MRSTKLKLAAIALGVAIGAATLASAAFLAPGALRNGLSDGPAEPSAPETHRLMNTGGSTNPCQCTHRIER